MTDKVAGLDGSALSEGLGPCTYKCEARPECACAPKQPAKSEEPVFTAEMIEAIYAAWHGAGVDIAGGNWKSFVGMLPRA